MSSDAVVDCCRQELVEKMFEALSVTSSDIQREIISCIPEVIDDMQHVDVAHKLKWVYWVVAKKLDQLQLLMTVF